MFYSGVLWSTCRTITPKSFAYLPNGSKLPVDFLAYPVMDFRVPLMKSEVSSSDVEACGNVPILQWRQRLLRNFFPTTFLIERNDKHPKQKAMLIPLREYPSLMLLFPCTVPPSHLNITESSFAPGHYRRTFACVIKGGVWKGCVC